MDRLYRGREYFARVGDDCLSLGWDDEVFFRLRPQSAVDANGETDREQALSGPEIAVQNGEWTVVWTGKSSLWAQKKYVFTLTGEFLTYRVSVSGEGEIDEARYFLGDDTRPRYGSSYEAADYCAPLGLANAPTGERRFSTAQPCDLGISGFTPGPFAFSFRVAGAEGRGLFGLGALPERCQFSRFSYRPLFFPLDVSRFTLTCDFGGATRARGEWTSPPILFCRAGDDLDALRRYADWHYDNGCPRPVRSKPPRWWRGPFYCGWKEQFLGDWNEANQHAAREECYRVMIGGLENRGLEPSAIIIDDKWQKDYGKAMPDPKKWPDLRRFIDEQHARGRRVLLWFKSWDAEGLPPEECILDRDGKPRWVDPTNPLYIKRLRQIVHTLLSADALCMNADGFKVDFADCLPVERGLRTHEPGVYGVGLLYRFFSILYAAAKQAKPDALVNTSCCHPLFAALTDQARLHDCFFALRDSVEIMTGRQRIFHAMIPGLLIDADAGSCGSRRDFLAYARASARIGVPDLYFLHPTGDCVLEDGDFEELRRIWTEYGENVDAEYLNE